MKSWKNLTWKIQISFVFIRQISKHRISWNLLGNTPGFRAGLLVVGSDILGSMILNSIIMDSIILDSSVLDSVIIEIPAPQPRSLDLRAQHQRWIFQFRQIREPVARNFERTATRLSNILMTKFINKGAKIGYLIHANYKIFFPVTRIAGYDVHFVTYHDSSALHPRPRESGRRKDKFFFVFFRCFYPPDSLGRG